MSISGICTGFEAESLGQFIRLMADPMFAVGLDGRVIAANKPFLELLGYAEDGLAGRPMSLFNGPPIEGLPPKSGEMDLVCRARNGTRLAVTASVSPVYVEEGPGAFIFSVKKKRQEGWLFEDLATRDELARRIEYLEDFRTGVLLMVKELESSEEELASAYRLLKETRDQLIQSSKMTALGELASALAHELSQPLTIIKGISQNMIGALDEGSPGHEKMTLVIHAAKKMESVIKHLRIFSRKDEPAMAPVDLNRVINEAFVMVKGLLSAHTIDVRMDLSPLPLILGSSVRLEQVIINIVTNARDAMPEGGVLEIKTKAGVENGRPCACLSISDSGAGISEENLKRVFDPFFTTKEPGKGTGIGLSISSGIIKEHGGGITVESAPGRGTSFHITIPAIVKN